MDHKPESRGIHANIGSKDVEEIGKEFRIYRVYEIREITMVTI